MNDQDNNDVSGTKRKADVNFFESQTNPRTRLNSPTTPLDEENELINYALNLALAPPLQSPPPPPPPPPQIHFSTQPNNFNIILPQPSPPPQSQFFPQPNEYSNMILPHPASPRNQFFSPQNEYEMIMQQPSPVSQPPPPSITTARPARTRRAPSQRIRKGKSDIIPAPYEWATDRRAKVHTLEYLLSKQIYTITGMVQCKKCERRYEMGFNLEEKFVEVARFIIENKTAMHDRAPVSWNNPVLPTCSFCEAENSVKPVVAEKKRSINWLFLLLGQMLGCCTLEQLKYFCKHTFNHRTGAKDRVLYLAYLCMCKQLDPLGPFAR